MSLQNSQPNPNPCSPASPKKNRKASTQPYEKMAAIWFLLQTKEVTLVIIDKDMFIEKCMALLNDEESIP